jgi:NAD-dependent deacetylase sirtuin 4
VRNSKKSHQKNNNNSTHRSAMSLRTTVPAIARAPSQRDFDELARFLSSWQPGRRIVALTGAGLSTESGLPDYRSPEIGAYARNHKPVTYQQFTDINNEFRTRFWLRSFLGFAKHRVVEPNAAHRALSQLERIRGAPLAGIVTQNVDGLHHAAGSRAVVELHGSLDRCVCLACRRDWSRVAVQENIQRLNPWLRAADLLGAKSAHLPPSDASVEMRPDGDVNVAAQQLFADAQSRFVLPQCDCNRPNALIKPSFVFFGENVPSAVAQAADELVASADLLLVLGTSVHTLSCMRLLRRADALGRPIAIVNAGPTKADDLANVRLKLDTLLGPTVSGIAEMIVKRLAADQSSPKEEAFI